MMRRYFVLAGLALVMLVGAGPAAADQIPVGGVFYDPFILGQPGFPGIDVFDVSNLTGLAFLPPSFPAATNLNFNNLILTVLLSGGGQQSFSVGTASPGFTTLGPQFLDTLGITSASLTGNFASTSITLADGSVVQINGTFSSTILPSSGSTLAAGADSAVIFATRSITNVPEPPSLLMLGAGFLLMGSWLGKRILR